MITSEFSKEEKSIINVISNGIEITEKPFELIARKCETTQDKVITLLERLLREKKIRRFCAIVRQRQAGYHSNAMCAFDIADEKTDSAGEFTAALNEVSHCYKRPRRNGWPYNFYAMIHAKSDGECEALAKKIAGFAGALNFKILYSLEELKKQSMRYFE